MGVSEAVEALKQAFPSDQVLLHGSERFATVNKSYLSALLSDITPACIVQPKSKEEVAKFLQIVKPFAASGETAFSIRGGGQQPMPGCSNIEGGINLDLSLLTGVDVKDGVVSVAAGERWGTVYEKLDGSGLAVNGGRSGRGGIGGLALSGGLSFFSSREGFISDNVVNFEVVLADSRIVNANADENPDLLLALRGGGNNFGVVTRYNLRSFPQGSIWGGSVYYFADSFPGQIDALVAELTKPDASEETHLMISIGYAAQFGQTMCQNQLYYTQPVEKPAVLDPFTEIRPQIDPMNSMRMMTLKEASSEQAAVAMDQVRCAYMCLTVKADVATLVAASEAYVAALEPIKPTEELICSLTLQSYPVSLLKQAVAHGGTSLGLDPAGGPLVSLLLLTYWKNKSDDERVLGVMKEALATIEKDAAARNTAVPFIYLNYAFNHQDPIRSYGTENKKKLQEVSKKYDPEGLFQKSVPGGFKLFP